jgi:DNA-binding response OmpR family regulator
MKLLIVDSDRYMVEMLSSLLKILGYEVHRAYTGEQASNKWTEHLPDLVILGNTLQDIDPLTMCRTLQREHDALVLVIAEEHNAHDEVRYLESGIDDYLRKPFFPDQLVARISALSRRTRSTIMQRPSPFFKVGPLRLDLAHNKVYIREKTIQLTPMEGKMLRLLAMNANAVCTTQQIVAHIWDFGDMGTANLIKTHIYHLRQKIELEPANPRHILTVPGIGYTLVCQLHEESSAG